MVHLLLSGDWQWLIPSSLQTGTPGDFKRYCRWKRCLTGPFYEPHLLLDHLAWHIRGRYLCRFEGTSTGFENFNGMFYTDHLPTPNPACRLPQTLSYTDRTRRPPHLKSPGKGNSQAPGASAAAETLAWRFTQVRVATTDSASKDVYVGPWVVR